MEKDGKNDGNLSEDTRRSLCLELDLDYFEDEYGAGIVTTTKKTALTPLQEFSPDSVDLVKVLMLGAPHVGKTSIIQQFVWNEFQDEYIPTDRKNTYYPSVIFNGRLIQLKISDIPAIPYFPVDALYEWTDRQITGLRNATAYILVFDLTNVETFQYIHTIKDQILECKDLSDVPLIVVGNKDDLKSNCGNISNLIRDEWKCCYIECSAKVAGKVMNLFKQVMKCIEDNCRVDACTEEQEESLHSIKCEERNKCLIL